MIAIDGHSSCGKSTLAKELAAALNYTYIDSGAMYRAVTLYFLEHQIDYSNTAAVKTALQNIQIAFTGGAKGVTTFLNGKDVEREIRQMRVSESVSQVSAISAVRRAMVQQQQALGQESGVVMDGRDIGTVVFPQAELKIFLTASIDIRAQRRYEELKAKGEIVDLETIKKNLSERDHIDSTREDSPLRQAEDAVLIDNSHLTRAEQLLIALDLVQERVDKIQDR